MIITRWRIVLAIFVLFTAFAEAWDTGRQPDPALFPPLSIDRSAIRVVSPPRALDLPLALASDRSHRLCVAEAFGDRISLLDDRGRLVRTFGKFGQAPGDLEYPCALDPLPNGGIAVLENDNSRIQWLDPGGHAIRVVEVGSDGLKGLAAFPDGTVYLGRSGSAFGGKKVFSVVEIGPDGKRRREWETHGAVMDVRREIGGRLWVLTTDGISLYTQSGRWVRDLAPPKSAPFVLGTSAPIDRTGAVKRFHPLCMCQAPDGRVYLGSDNYVLVYNSRYRPLGSLPAALFTVQRILALTVDRRNRLWAVDEFNHLICIPLDAMPST